jgi:hypothetical protein
MNSQNNSSSEKNNSLEKARIKIIRVETIIASMCDHQKPNTLLSSISVEKRLRDLLKKKNLLMLQRLPFSKEHTKMCDNIDILSCP